MEVCRAASRDYFLPAANLLNIPDEQQENSWLCLTVQPEGAVKLLLLCLRLKEVSNHVKHIESPCA